ncbi:tripartite tricarboxylate transporter substrate binding protein [Hydrogenophaga sp. 2FB]|uniref:Bug family tripartite tricarboxylate transporter substrate binding protein n=1 Tax=Hydrogenophaga sp. 2FB TaxID=2502187 RepID=UPI0010F9B0CE|nr:tripartite tricarboxylate transporter substrate binding protein [Hydrogenophaga sp. 2FB]
MKRRQFLICAGGGAAAVLSVPVLGQQNWPTRPIRLVVPYAAGGPTDVVARLIGARVGQELGQSVVVDNRAGANGAIATEYVVRSLPDGYTLLYHSAGIATNMAVQKNSRIDPRRDLAAVGQTISINAVLLVNPDVPAKDARQLVAYLKAHPGKLSYASGGIGNGSHLQMEALLRTTGASAVHVPYKGTAPALTDLASGQVQFAFDALSSALPHIQAGRVRAIAVTSAARDPLLKDVPTLAESLLPGYQNTGWNGIYAPAGTPTPIVERLSKALIASLEDDSVKHALGQQGVRVVTSTPQQFAEWTSIEIERYSKIARIAQVSVD